MITYNVHLEVIQRSMSGPRSGVVIAEKKFSTSFMPQVGWIVRGGGEYSFSLKVEKVVWDQADDQIDVFLEKCFECNIELGAIRNDLSSVGWQCSSIHG